jgi:hypothetical protein
MTWFPIFQAPDFKRPDFKRPVEFQTSVLGGGWPGKRNFCGIPLIFARRLPLSAPPP